MTADLGLTAGDRRVLTELRRDLHRHPELSWHETRTQERLERALRATTAATRALLAGELSRMARAVAETHRLAVDVRITEGTPPVVNTPDGAAWAARAVRDVLGEDALVPLGTTNMGGEDSACYLEQLPGCFMRIGAREPGGEHLPAHTPRFFPAEEALFIGSAVLAQCARVAGSPSNG